MSPSVRWFHYQPFQQLSFRDTIDKGKRFQKKESGLVKFLTCSLCCLNSHFGRNSAGRNAIKYGISACLKTWYEIRINVFIDFSCYTVLNDIYAKKPLKCYSKRKAGRWFNNSSFVVLFLEQNTFNSMTWYRFSPHCKNIIIWKVW